MQIIDPGHTYHLDNVEGGVQELSFINKAPASDTDPTLVTVQNGTTNEDVLNVVLDRMHFLDEKMPCDENKQVITCLENALTILATRTADRQARDVEGTSQA